MSSVRLSFITLGLALATASSASAQSGQPARPAPANVATQAVAAGAKIGFVNAGALLKGMPGYAQAESLWTKDAESANAEAVKLRTVFDTAVSQYQQSQAMMTPSSRSAKEKQLQAQGDSLQAKLEALRARVGNKERELLTPLQERLRAIIDGVRAEGNYALILDLASEASVNIISFDKSLDITIKVAQRLAQTN
ncbi:MAG: OmpH family outer membrane protein [Gemmatimonadales bacterium]